MIRTQPKLGWIGQVGSTVKLNSAPRLISKEENVVIFRRYRNIVYRRVSTRYFIEKYRSDDISGFIAINSRNILAINRRFFPIYRMVNAGQRKLDALQCPPICLLSRGFEPQTRLPPGLTCLLVYNMQHIYIYLSSLYKENIRIF